MTAQSNLMKKTKQKRMRRMRLYGLNNSILSNVTVYLNPHIESNDHLSPEDSAFYAAVAKYLSDID